MCYFQTYSHTYIQSQSQITESLIIYAKKPMIANALKLNLCRNRYFHNWIDFRVNLCASNIRTQNNYDIKVLGCHLVWPLMRQRTDLYEFQCNSFRFNLKRFNDIYRWLKCISMWLTELRSSKLWLLCPKYRWQFKQMFALAKSVVSRQTMQVLFNMSL